MKKLTLLFLIVASISATAQDLSQGYYSYRMSLYNLNPAFAGDDSSLVANLITRSYLSGYDGNPRNNLLGVHGSLTPKIGIGAKLMSDSKGEFTVSRYDVMGSYKVQFSEDVNLRFGVSAGVIRRTLNSGNVGTLDITNQNDPVLAGGYLDETSFVLGAGVLIHAKNIKIGFSAPNLVETLEQPELNPSSTDFYVGTFSYRHDLQFKKLFITPSAIYQNIPTLENQIDLYLKIDRNQKFWVLAGYQTTNMMTFGGGVSLGPIEIGYIHGLPTGQLNGISSSLNEIMLQLKFANAANKK
jgi:type IX secretion system PorP/SprF family membrane protein